MTFIFSPPLFHAVLLTSLLILSTLCSSFTICRSIPVSPSRYYQLDSYSCIFLMGFLSTTLTTSPQHMHKHLTPPSYPPTPTATAAAASLLGSISWLCSKTGALRQQEMGTGDNRIQRTTARVSDARLRNPSMLRKQNFQTLKLIFSLTTKAPFSWYSRLCFSLLQESMEPWNSWWRWKHLTRNCLSVLVLTIT